jgi:hypothetical protein
VRLAQARLFERPAAHGSVGAVEHALGAVLLNAVALDVPEVQRRGLGAVRRQPHHARLDDDAARVGPMSLGPQGPPKSAAVPPPRSETRARISLTKRSRTAVDTPSSSLSETGPKDRQIVG